jgi:ankyrin repeat protein
MIRITRNSSRADLLQVYSGYPEHMAVVNDDVAELAALLRAKDGDRDVVHHGNHCHTPLSLAVTLNRTAIVQFLIGAGAVVDVVLDKIWNCPTLVQFAAMHCDEALLRVLLDATKDRYIRSYRRNTLCHYAARNANPAIVALVIAAGLPFDEPNDDGKRPSHWAATFSNEAVLQVLLDAGCDVDARDADQNSLAHNAAFNTNEKVLAAVLKARGGADDVNVLQESVALVAAANTNDAVMRLVLAAAPHTANARARYGKTPFQVACVNPNHKVLEALVAAGAELCPLACHTAAKNRNEEVIKLLFRLGADVNERQPRCRSNAATLHDALVESSAAAVAAMLAAGADVNFVDAGENACHFAAYNDDSGVMRLVTAAGVDCTIAHHRFGTPFAIAVAEGKIETARALIDVGVDAAAEIRAIWTEPVSVARTAATVRFAIRHGANARAFFGDQFTQTPLHWASAAAFDELFARGADIDAPNSDGKSPLRIAIDRDVEHDCAKTLTLIAAGADMDWIVRDDVLANQWVDPLALAYITAAGAPLEGEAADHPPRVLAWARHRIAARQLQMLRLRALQVCIGLHALDLSALVLCEILAFAFAPRTSLVEFHQVWAMVTAVKHFHKNSYPQ